MQSRMKSIYIYRIKVLISFLSLLVLIFNIVGFNVGFLYIRFTTEDAKLQVEPIDQLVVTEINTNHPSPIPTHHALPPTTFDPSLSLGVLNPPARTQRIQTRHSTPSLPLLRWKWSTEGNPNPGSSTGVKHSKSPCLFQKGRDPDDGKWYDFSDRTIHFYAYSAFMDDRPSIRSRPLVRIIALASVLINDSLEDDGKSLFCVFHYNKTIPNPWNQQYDSRTIIIPMEFRTRPIGFGWRLGVVDLKEYIFTCSSGIAHHSLPMAVTVVSSPKRLSSVTSCVPIEFPPKPRTKDDIAVCIQVSYGSLDPHRLIEWLELQRLLGVTRVGVYSMNLHPGPGLDVLTHYSREGFVELRRTEAIPIPGEDQHLLQGSPVINDCMYRNMYSFKWILVIDFDEIIIPRTHSNLKEMVSYLEKTTLGKTPPPVNFFFLNQYYFLDSSPDTNVSTNYTILRYRKKAPLSPQGYAMKSYVNPLTCAQMHNHYCMGVTDGVDEGNMYEFVEPSVGTNNHYKKCHLSADRCRTMLNQTTTDDVIMTYEVTLKKNVETKAGMIFG